LSLKIFYENTAFRLKDSGKTKRHIEKVIGSEGKSTGDLNFIFTDDETLLKINIDFLNHDYYTDVITFDYDSENRVNGEVYISFDTVKRNAFNYNVSLNEEILRVMIHGVLHLLGYDDKKQSDTAKMREMEERWLKEF